jgi:hypothetical protein
MPYGQMHNAVSCRLCSTGYCYRSRSSMSDATDQFMQAQVRAQLRSKYVRNYSCESNCIPIWLLASLRGFLIDLGHIAYCLD